MNEEEVNQLGLVIKLLDLLLPVAAFCAGAYFTYVAISMGLIG